MPVYQDVISDVEALEDGPHIAAIFDFDRTIISGFSAFVFLGEQLRQGLMTRLEFIEVMTEFFNIVMGFSDFRGVIAQAGKIADGVHEETYLKFGEDVYKKHLAKRIYPESRELVRAHLRKGHTVAIISSATPYQVLPAAKDLAIDHVLCSELEVKNGIFTGNIIDPPCWGEGKLIAAEALAKKHGLNLDNSVFYTDSEEDLELLERIGHRRILNPSKKLASIAKEREWPIRRFTSRGRSNFGQVFRTLSTYSAMVGSYFGGLALSGLTGSKAEGRNFTVGLFADLTTAMIGLKLQVSGEENLWTRRPAVFLINHQSNADGIIAYKLLRKDIQSSGNTGGLVNPVWGRIHSFINGIPGVKGAVYNQVNPESLVETIKNDNVSVCLAPEVDRSYSINPGPFSKDPFKIAMEAGVPVIPIVIHNSLDVLPRGEFIYRPATVKIEVLAPVDTGGWTDETLDEKVLEIRNKYLETLGLSIPGDAEILPD